MSVPDYMKDHWIDLKWIYQNVTGGYESGMVMILKALHLKLNGKHHSRIDDTVNITDILRELIRRGFVYSPTNKVI